MESHPLINEFKIESKSIGSECLIEAGTEFKALYESYIEKARTLFKDGSISLDEYRELVLSLYYMACDFTQIISERLGVGHIEVELYQLHSSPTSSSQI